MRANRITKRNSGSQLVTPPFELKPSSDSPQPSWNTRTSTPYAAPTESRLRMIALIGITIERKVTSINRKVSPKTNAKISGSLLLSWFLSSTESAASPVTFTLAPSTPPIVAGTMSSRISFRAFD